MIVLAVYISLFVAGYFAVYLYRRRSKQLRDYNTLKTVTFGDESAIRPDRVASAMSVLVIFLIWGAFTGSKLVPFHVPAPFIGDLSFTYSATNAAGETGDANVVVRVYPGTDKPANPEVSTSTGLAANVGETTAAWRSVLVKTNANSGANGEGFMVTAINGQPIAPSGSVSIDNATVSMTPKGTLSVSAYTGLQMEPIWLPAPEKVFEAFVRVGSEGYQNISLWQHLAASLTRVIGGFLLGSLIGIPLGYAMGLSGWFRGWFDPIVEFMRPVPPLALIPLVIIWFGIWETGKLVLLFLAALWIMTIAARSGVSGVRISKIQAAYSLGASKTQIMRHVIIPNSLPNIFTGARVAMGVCWGTVVAAELVAAQKGAGMMIIAASKFQLTDIVVMGIILIGIIGYGIDILMRMTEKYLVPWQGRG